MNWVLAARPKTLLAAVVPVWVGTALCWKLFGAFDSRLALFTVASALCIQVATNYFNDALDFAKGADTSARIGPARAGQSGALSTRALHAGAFAMLVLACVLALPLIAARGWPILAIGIPSLYFSFGYTGGPMPLAYRGLGELFVILFFGLVAVTGTVFVQSGEWRWEALLAGTQVGLLSTALIAINNLRDVAEDTRAKKRTLAVRFGQGFARWEILVLLGLPFDLGIVWGICAGWWSGFWWPLAALPLAAVIVLRIWESEPSREYNRYLGMAAGVLMLFAVLFQVAAT